MIEVGQTIGNYRITAKLGEGGMGIVYLAEHPVIGKKVAMKAIHPELSRNQEVISRFMVEAKSVNQIGNEHIVDISDFGTTAEGEFYFIMEFLQGEAMADRLKRERILPPTRALAIAAQVADALGASHEHGIVHRDLKPENVFLIGRGANKDFVKVLDFGLAKLTQGDEKVSHKTRTGSVMGTPYYMSPEQCEGKPSIDHRSDIYSLGVILFEMLTGKVPFGGEGYGEIIVKHITMPPPSPRAINPALAESLERIVYKALAKNKDQRFQTMADFRAALVDPEGWSAGAPMLPVGEGAVVAGAMPVSRADVGSGQVGFGSGMVGPDSGGPATPTPSTFRSGMGEIIDDLPPPRSRKGLILGITAAVVLGGAAAVVVLSGGTLSAKKPPAQPVAAAVSPVPAKPKTVKISFTSDPPGARVVNAETGKEIGMTPVSVDFPYGDAPAEFVFKKEGFVEKKLPFIPNVPFASIPVALVKEAPPPAATTTSTPSSSSSRKSRPKKTSSRPLHLDDDAVLEPSFR